MVIQKRFLSFSVNCTGHTDSYFCGTGYFIQSNCDRYSNVPILCPTMCKVCPCKSLPNTDIGLLHFSTREFFTHGETASGCKFGPMLDTHGH